MYILCARGLLRSCLPFLSYTKIVSPTILPCMDDFIVVSTIGRCSRDAQAVKDFEQYNRLAPGQPFLELGTIAGEGDDKCWPLDVEDGLMDHFSGHDLGGNCSIARWEDYERRVKFVGEYNWNVTHLNATEEEGGGGGVVVFNQTNSTKEKNAEPLAPQAEYPAWRMPTMLGLVLAFYFFLLLAEIMFSEGRQTSYKVKPVDESAEEDPNSDPVSSGEASEKPSARKTVSTIMSSHSGAFDEKDYADLNLGFFKIVGRGGVFSAIALVALIAVSLLIGTKAERENARMSQIIILYGVGLYGISHLVGSVIYWREGLSRVIEGELRGLADPLESLVKFPRIKKLVEWYHEYLAIHALGKYSILMVLYLETFEIVAQTRGLVLLAPYTDWKILTD